MRAVGVVALERTDHRDRIPSGSVWCGPLIVILDVHDLYWAGVSPRHLECEGLPSSPDRYQDQSDSKQFMLN